MHRCNAELLITGVAQLWHEEPVFVLMLMSEEICQSTGDFYALCTSVCRDTFTAIYILQYPLLWSWSHHCSKLWSHDTDLGRWFEIILTSVCHPLHSLCHNDTMQQQQVMLSKSLLYCVRTENKISSHKSYTNLLLHSAHQHTCPFEINFGL